MSICEFSVNMKNKCENCKDFKLYDKTGIFGHCISDETKIRQKENKSMKSKCCTAIRRIEK